jgi:hypothetical protein
MSTYTEAVARLIADGHTSDQARQIVERLLAPRRLAECPTPCDDDCEAECHELHQVSWKRTHTPESHGAGRRRAEVDDDEFPLAGDEPPDPPDEE